MPVDRGDCNKVITAVIAGQFRVLDIIFEGKRFNKSVRYIQTTI